MRIVIAGTGEVGRHLAKMLRSGANVLLLDEPTTGLDPQARRRVWEIVEQFKESGRTVLLTTHYMDEAENADRIAVIDHGEIQALDSPAGLKAMVGGDLVTVGAGDLDASLDDDLNTSVARAAALGRHNRGVRRATCTLACRDG